MAAENASSAKVENRKSPRRWFRFSLATLFIVLTIGCVWLGLVVNRAHRNLRAVATINGFGGHVEYGFQYDRQGRRRYDADIPWPKWLCDWLGIEVLDDIVGVRLGEARIDGVGTPWKENLVTDHDVAALRELPRLRVVSFVRSPVSDAGCAHLETYPALEDLDLSHTSITDVGLEHLGRCRRLKFLNVSNCRVTSLGASKLIGLSLLDTIAFHDTPIDDSGMDHLAKIRSLKNIYIAGTNVTDRGLEQLATLKLECLALMRTCVTGAGLVHLRGHPTLERLHLNHTNIGDDDVHHLATIPNLGDLSLRDSRVSDNCVKDISRCVRLWRLNIDKGQLSPEAVQRLQQALPNCHIAEW